MADWPTEARENDRAIEVNALVAGERVAQNERVLHAVLRARAEALTSPVSSLSSPGLFRSFFIGGFECATHRRRDSRRLDTAAYAALEQLVVMRNLM